MKITTRSQSVARESSLRTLSLAYKKMSEQLSDLSSKRIKFSLELIWFLKDENGKIVKTGGCNQMPFRRNQLWRKFTKEEYHKNCTVHLLDVLSGIQTEKPFIYAYRRPVKYLREEMINEILGLK